jgi:hypothetical protein
MNLFAARQCPQVLRVNIFIVMIFLSADSIFGNGHLL